MEIEFRDGDIDEDVVDAIIERIIAEEITEEMTLCEIISRREGVELTLEEATQLLEMAEERLEAGDDDD